MCAAPLISGEIAPLFLLPFEKLQQLFCRRKSWLLSWLLYFCNHNFSTSCSSIVIFTEINHFLKYISSSVKTKGGRFSSRKLSKLMIRSDFSESFKVIIGNFTFKRHLASIFPTFTEQRIAALIKKSRDNQRTTCFQFLNPNWFPSLFFSFHQVDDMLKLLSWFLLICYWCKLNMIITKMGVKNVPESQGPDLWVGYELVELL